MLRHFWGDQLQVHIYHLGQIDGFLTGAEQRSSSLNPPENQNSPRLPWAAARKV
jgi:hypothetical protein